jgi:hypothetical protein
VGRSIGLLVVVKLRVEAEVCLGVVTARLCLGYKYSGTVMVLEGAARRD